MEIQGEYFLKKKERSESRRPFEDKRELRRIFPMFGSRRLQRVTTWRVYFKPCEVGHKRMGKPCHKTLCQKNTILFLTFCKVWEGEGGATSEGGGDGPRASGSRWASNSCPYMSFDVALLCWRTPSRAQSTQTPRPIENANHVAPLLVFWDFPGRPSFGVLGRFFRMTLFSGGFSTSER